MNVGEFPSDHERLPRTGRNVLPEPQGASTGHGDDARALLHAGNGEDPPGQFLHNIERRVLLQLGVRVGRCGPGAGPAPLRQDALVHLYLHLSLLCSPAISRLYRRIFSQDFRQTSSDKTSSAQLSAALVAGKPMVVRARTMVCRISASDTPMPSSLRTCERTPPSDSAPTAIPSLIRRRSLSAKGPASCSAAPRASNASFTAGKRRWKCWYTSGR